MVARKRGATGLSGMLLIDKPAGLTSHDVVARLRRATGEGRIGHAGTLDPMATGLMVVLVGSATRLEPFLSAQDKRYIAAIRFGSATDTDDAEGQVVRRASVPDAVADPGYAQTVLAGFAGDFSQMPPAFSAIKVQGTTAHRAARAGSPIELTPRPITVFEAKLLGVEREPATWDVEFLVSKGTYIRSLARDVGESVGSAAHLSALRRSASGPLAIGQAASLDRALATAEAGSLGALWVDPALALEMQVVSVDPALAANGRALPRDVLPQVTDGDLVAVCSATSPVLLGVYRVHADRIIPQVVFAGGVGRGE